MSCWFDEKDDIKTVIEHLEHKHIPDSIKEAAANELRNRGWTNRQIEDEISRQYWSR